VLLVTPSIVVERREVDVDALVLYHLGGNGGVERGKTGEQLGRSVATKRYK
jgi:hypothetical protein